MTAATAAEKEARVYYARALSYAQPGLDAALSAVLTPLLAEAGGAAGKRVMVKPNLLEYRKPEDPACVHPALLTALCRQLLAAGASAVAVIENPAVRTCEAVLERMGILSELRQMGVTAATCQRYETLTLPETSRFRRVELAAEFRDYDLVIDFAKVKTHAMMTFTLGVKNLFGLVRGSERLAWHLAVGRDYGEFADLLLDIREAVRPGITLLDGITAMEGNGPGSGEPVTLGFLAGSVEPLAADLAVSARLGTTATPILERAGARGILPAKVAELGELPDFPPVKLPDPPRLPLSWGVYFPPSLRRLLRRLWVSRPEVDRHLCVGCGVCASMCPPQSLKIRGGKAVFDLKNCIRCYCCQEHCPKGAIRSRATFFMRLASRLEKILRLRK